MTVRSPAAAWTVGQEQVPGDDGRRLRVVEVVGQLVGGEQDVEGHHRVAGVVAAEEGDGELGDVGQDQGDVLAGPDAEVAQGAGEHAGEQVEGGVVHLGVAGDDGRLGRVGGGGLAEDGAEVRHGFIVRPAGARTYRGQPS